MDFCFFLLLDLLWLLYWFLLMFSQKIVIQIYFYQA